MNGFEDALMNTILGLISEKVGKKVLENVPSGRLKKKLLKAVTKELFYKLLIEKRVDLAPGFGSFILKERKEKEKKVYDRKSMAMVSKHIHGHKIVYKPGEALKEFL